MFMVYSAVYKSIAFPAKFRTKIAKISLLAGIQKTDRAHAQQPPDLQAITHTRVHPKAHPNI